MLNVEFETGTHSLTFIGKAGEWMGRTGRAVKGESFVFTKGSSRRIAPDPSGLVPPGGVERRIVAEVAVQLRISPRFSDDGAPEGYCERPLSIHIDRENGEDESEEELDLNEEFNRAFRDARVR